MRRSRPGVVEIQQQRFKCKQLLEKFCSERQIGVRDIVGKGNLAHIMVLRREFIRLAYDADIGLAAIASVVRRDSSTVDYHVRGLRAQRREEKAAYKLAQRSRGIYFGENIHG